jgi:hypothetical protein
MALHVSTHDPFTPTPDYHERHRPEQTVVYQVFQQHWPAFREQAEEVGGLPKFVVREVEEFLRCGRLEAGCLHCRCRRCGYSHLVAFSCKRRGAICSSCAGRRMADIAVHLEEQVLPPVPIRHWICTLPWGLRALLGYDRELCSEVLGAFAGEVMRSLKWRAKRALGLSSIQDAHTGTVAVVQRVDSSLRLNVHFHLLALDGVYIRQEHGALVWHSLPTPTRAEVQDVAARTARCIQRILRAHGRSLDPALQTVDEPDRFAQDQPALAACYAAAAQGVSLAPDRAGQPTVRLMVSCNPPEHTQRDLPDEPVAEVGGVNLHAKVVIDGRDRKRVERLVRYIARPVLSEERVEQRQDGRVQLTLKSPWRDGTRAFIFEPFDLIARLCAAVPPPRFHMLRYHGVLAAHSHLRSEVTPRPPAFEDPMKAPASGDQRQLFEPTSDANQPPPHRRPWAWLLRHVFLKDVSHCPRCGGPMRWVEVATTKEPIERLMAEHGEEPAPAPRRTPVPPEQVGFSFRFRR